MIRGNECYQVPGRSEVHKDPRKPPTLLKALVFCNRLSKNGRDPSLATLMPSRGPTSWRILYPVYSTRTVARG